MNALLNWWSAASAAEKRKLAADVGSTVSALHQAAHAYRSEGRPQLTPRLAGKIEAALRGKVKRADMSPDCAACMAGRSRRA